MASEELTTYQSVPGLVGQFTYDNQEVSHLWKVRLDLANTGDKTIIGEGLQTNIMGDGISLLFPQGMKIIKVFPLENVQRETEQAKTPQPNQLVLAFGQLRSGESLTTELYVASDEPHEGALIPDAGLRQVIDGEMRISDSTDRTQTTDNSKFKGMPEGLIVAAMGVFSLIAAMLVLVALSSTLGTLRLWTWKSRNDQAFSVYIRTIRPFSEQDCARYEKDPAMLPDKYWTDFKGTRIPRVSDKWEDPWMALVITPIAVLLAACSGILLYALS